MSVGLHLDLTGSELQRFLWIWTGSGPLHNSKVEDQGRIWGEFTEMKCGDCVLEKLYLFNLGLCFDFGIAFKTLLN